jgi:hypothetical protein
MAALPLARIANCLGSVVELKTQETQRKVRAVNMFVKAEGPSGPAKIRSDDPKQALGLAQYLRTIGYNAWIEDTNGNAIDEKALKMAIKYHHEDSPSS